MKSIKNDYKIQSQFLKIKISYPYKYKWPNRRIKNYPLRFILPPSHSSPSMTNDLIKSRGFFFLLKLTSNIVMKPPNPLCKLLNSYMCDITGYWFKITIFDTNWRSLIKTNIHYTYLRN